MGAAARRLREWIRERDRFERDCCAQQRTKLKDGMGFRHLVEGTEKHLRDPCETGLLTAHFGEAGS